MTEKLSSWDVEDDDINNNENLIFDEKSGLYKKIRRTKNEKDQPCQETLEFKLQTFELSKSVQARKSCKKFGKAKNDEPGPNPSHTFLGDELFMKFYTDEIVLVEEEKKAPTQSVRCRNCQGDHFTLKCPYKDEIKNIQELTVQIERITEESAQNNEDKPMAEININTAKSGSYLPPHMRENAQRVGTDKKRSDSALTVRVSNLPEDAQEKDLDDLFRPFGNISRIFLVKDRQTGLSRCFAYVTFSSRFDAAKAIDGVNGFGYDHCILQVQWSE